MTNYNKWDKQAADLEKELEEEEALEKAECDKALGLEGGPKGPPTAKAEKGLEELGQHSNERKGFIEWHKKTMNDIVFTHESQAEPIVLTKADVDGKCVRLSSSVDTTYVFPEGTGAKKIVVESCRRVQVQVDCSLPTSTMEAYRCSDVEVMLALPLGTFQVDECVDALRLRYGEREHLGSIYHQNSPGLAVGWGGRGSDVDFLNIGYAGDFQSVTRRAPAGCAEPLVTGPVRRGEGEFPIDLPTADGTAPYAEGHQPEPEALPNDEERKRQADEKRQKGNDMFRANDFLQAAMEYTGALELDPAAGTVWANRAQCWLRVGDHDKALADATQCTVVDPTNAKGWFRKGMSFHAMKRYGEAIGALLEAEKLDPKNKQVEEAIKMAQLMARKHGPGGPDA